MEEEELLFDILFAIVDCNKEELRFAMSKINVPFDKLKEKLHNLLSCLYEEHSE